MKIHEIDVVESSGIHRAAEFIAFGIPFAPGENANSALWVVKRGEQCIPHATTELARWGDGSISWMLVECLVELMPNEHLTLRIMQDPQV